MTMCPRAGPVLAVVLGIAVLLLAVPGKSEGARCEPTPPDAEGPFYRPGAPERNSTGNGFTVKGRVLGAPGCRPLPGARVEWWHANPAGEYDDAHRGSQTTAGDGSYRFTTDYPGLYPGRTRHIHFKASAPGFHELTTQLYLRGGAKVVTFDLVLSPN